VNQQLQHTSHSSLACGVQAQPQRGKISFSLEYFLQTKKEKKEVNLEIYVSSLIPKKN
jgi:hypothetical protein